MGFFSNLFGKKTCSLCGKECGVMSRNKIREKLYICNECGNLCSKHIRLSEYTLDGIKEHIECMKKQQKLFEEVYKPCTGKLVCPGVKLDKQGIEFCDELGLFRIVDRNTTARGAKLVDLFRYDQIASYEPYLEETHPTEEELKKGVKPEVDECGIKIKLLTANDNANASAKHGTRVHPYVKRELKICFSTKEKSTYIETAINHLNGIFGVNDGNRGLFQFGLTKEEKRTVMGVKGAMDIFGEAMKTAKTGELSDEAREKIEGGINAIDDAATGGLAVYTRRADEAEAKIK